MRNVEIGEGLLFFIPNGCLEPKNLFLCHFYFFLTKMYKLIKYKKHEQSRAQWYTISI